MKPLTRPLLFLVVTLMACGSVSGPEQPTNDTTPTTSPSTVPPGTIPDDSGPVFIDRTEVLLMESFPVQVSLHVVGNLPTPCHEVVWELEDDGATIAVRVASVADPEVICSQVLEPFDISIPLGSFESGAREVTINGQPAGDFEI